MAIWSTVPLLVDSKLRGLTFGIMTSIQNLSQTLVPAVVSILLTPHYEAFLHHHRDSAVRREHPPPDLATVRGIIHTEIFFAALAAAGIVGAMVVWYYDEWPVCGPGGFLRKSTMTTMNHLFQEHTDRMNDDLPPLHTTRMTVVQPDLPPGDGDLTGIAVRRQRGNSLEALSIPIPLPEQRTPSPGDFRSRSQSPQYAMPWETYNAAVGATEKTPLLQAQGGARHRSYSNSVPPMSTSIGPTSGHRFDADFMEEGLMPMKKAVSFAGDRFPERKPGQGQHPSIPLKRRNSSSSAKLQFAHF